MSSDNSKPRRLAAPRTLIGESLRARRSQHAREGRGRNVRVKPKARRTMSGRR